MAEKARNPSILLILVVLFLFSSGGFGWGAAAVRVGGCKAQLQHFKEMNSQKLLVFEEKPVKHKAMDSHERSFNVNFRGGAFQALVLATKASWLVVDMKEDETDFGRFWSEQIKEVLQRSDAFKRYGVRVLYSDSFRI